MTMFTHREKRQKHRDKTASSAIHELPDRQTGGQTDKLKQRWERAALSFCIEENIYVIDWLIGRLKSNRLLFLQNEGGMQIYEA